MRVIMFDKATVCSDHLECYGYGRDTSAQRYFAWWFNAGFHECCNVGKCGHELAEEVPPLVLDLVPAQGQRGQLVPE